jgi:hypothetical protein
MDGRQRRFAVGSTLVLVWLQACRLAIAPSANISLFGW